LIKGLEINNYKQALNLIKNSHYILIVTHLNPDADTISCGLALSNYFYENKIKHKVFNKMDMKNHTRLNYLDRFDKITTQIPKFYDLIIYVDCGDKNRVGIEFDNKVKIINIDHHISNDNFGTINIVDSNKASSAEVLYQFFIDNNLTISPQTAKCLYTGIYDDSLKFSTPRTDETTFNVVNELVKLGVNPSEVASNLTQRESLAKYRLLPKILNSLELHFQGEVATIYILPKWLEQTGAFYWECEDAINMILNIAIVDIAIFLRVSNGKTRVSLRSKKTDVSLIANFFGGGGHKNAAGCSLDTLDVTEAKEIILNKLKVHKIEKEK